MARLENNVPHLLKTWGLFQRFDMAQDFLVEGTITSRANPSSHGHWRGPAFAAGVWQREIEPICDMSASCRAGAPAMTREEHCVAVLAVAPVVLSLGTALSAVRQRKDAYTLRRVGSPPRAPALIVVTVEKQCVTLLAETPVSLSIGSTRHAVR